jgi:hypothetical protein
VSVSVPQLAVLCPNVPPPEEPHYKQWLQAWCVCVVAQSHSHVLALATRGCTAPPPLLPLTRPSPCPLLIDWRFE